MSLAEYRRRLVFAIERKALQNSPFCGLTQVYQTGWSAAPCARLELRRFLHSFAQFFVVDRRRRVSRPAGGLRPAVGRAAASRPRLRSGSGSGPGREAEPPARPRRAAISAARWPSSNAHAESARVHVQRPVAGDPRRPRVARDLRRRPRPATRSTSVGRVPPAGRSATELGRGSLAQTSLSRRHLHDLRRLDRAARCGCVAVITACSIPGDTGRRARGGGAGRAPRGRRRAGARRAPRQELRLGQQQGEQRRGAARPASRSPQIAGAGEDPDVVQVRAEARSCRAGGRGRAANRAPPRSAARRRSASAHRPGPARRTLGERRREQPRRSRRAIDERARRATRPARPRRRARPASTGRADAPERRVSLRQRGGVLGRSPARDGGEPTEHAVEVGPPGSGPPFTTASRSGGSERRELPPEPRPTAPRPVQRAPLAPRRWSDGHATGTRRITSPVSRRAPRRRRSGPAGRRSVSAARSPACPRAAPRAGSSCRRRSRPTTSTNPGTRSRSSARTSGSSGARRSCDDQPASRIGMIR